MKKMILVLVAVVLASSLAITQQVQRPDFVGKNLFDPYTTIAKDSSVTSEVFSLGFYPTTATIQLYSTGTVARPTYIDIYVLWSNFDDDASYTAAAETLFTGRPAGWIAQDTFTAAGYKKVHDFSDVVPGAKNLKVRLVNVSDSTATGRFTNAAIYLSPSY
jgi:hypothetical protein